MKTQIILRFILSAATLFLSANGKLNNVQNIPMVKNTAAVFTANTVSSRHEMLRSGIHCCISILEHSPIDASEPIIEHEFHPFHYDHHKRSNFWKAIALKTLSFFYYFILLIANLPVFISSFNRK